MDIQAIHERTLDRVTDVRPSMACGLTPECDGEMRPRHSVLSKGATEPYVEDIQVKCTDCLSTQKHGIGLTRAAYERELDARDGERIINFVTDWPARERDEHLAALGYKEL